MRVAQMIWRKAMLAIFIAAGTTTAFAAKPDTRPEQGDLDQSTAQALVGALIRNVETRALRPRSQAEYDAAKARLIALVNAPSPVEPRATVYAAAREMLSTLDTDGHTLLWSREQMSAWQNATAPQSGSDASAVRSITATTGRTVLVLRPPQTTFIDVPSTRTYVSGMIEHIRNVISTDLPCAVVVDLSAQEGGNAWPAIAVLAPLITSANNAHFVDRDGGRSPVVASGGPEWAFGGPLPSNELSRYAGHAFAIVLAPQTASAGEMVAIALRGQPNARTFGRKTYGATTGNVVTALPDGATILLTTSRYAIGNEPPLRGPLVPDVPAPTNESADATLQQAVSWAAQNCFASTR